MIECSYLPSPSPPPFLLPPFAWGLVIFGRLRTLLCGCSSPSDASEVKRELPWLLSPIWLKISGEGIRLLPLLFCPPCIGRSKLCGPLSSSSVSFPFTSPPQVAKNRSTNFKYKNWKIKRHFPCFLVYWSIVVRLIDWLIGLFFYQTEKRVDITGNIEYLSLLFRLFFISVFLLR